MQTRQQQQNSHAVSQIHTPANQQTPEPLTRSASPTALLQRAMVDPQTLTRAGALQLHRTIGNRAVGRLVSSGRAMNAAGPGRRQDELKRKNTTGLPDHLKAGIETLAGLSLDDVKVHYNSTKPAQLQALAYTQGAEIHVSPGQEHHMPHEVWHVVQQRQGRVQPTMRANGVAINDEQGLEKEAEVMGQKALHVGPTAPHALESAWQPATSQGHSVVQRRYDFERFSTYAEAKNSTLYAQKLLDQQTQPIEAYVGKGFDTGQRQAIYEINKKVNEGNIKSDEKDNRTLALQDSTITPHIDHRFPKSQGGTNDYTNAQILPAKINIAKSNKTQECETEPTTALTPYTLLKNNQAFDSTKIGTFREFTADQRTAIKNANKAHYGGQLTSDGDGTTPLSPVDSSQVANVDHIVPKSNGGSNFYFNAAVLPMDKNIKKGGVRGREKSEDVLDYEIGEMTLKKYYTNRRKLQAPKHEGKPPSQAERLTKKRSETQETIKAKRQGKFSAARTKNPGKSEEE